MSTIHKIKLVNWEKYRARSDVKKSWWVKLKNTILEEPEFYSMEPELFRCWIYFICEGSKQGKSEILISDEKALKQSNIDPKIVEKCINYLCQFGIIERIRNASDTRPNEIRTDHVPQIRLDKIRKETTLSLFPKGPDVKTFDLEDAYQSYPRRDGKKKGLAKLKTMIKTQDQYDNFCLAIKNYQHYLRINKKSLEFTKIFSTFVSEWEDWLNPQVYEQNLKGKEQTIMLDL